MAEVSKTTETITKDTVTVESKGKYTIHLEVTRVEGKEAEWQLTLDTKSRGRAKMRRYREAVEEKTGARPYGYGRGDGPTHYEGEGEYPQELIDMAEQLG